MIEISFPVMTKPLVYDKFVIMGERDKVMNTHFLQNISVYQEIRNTDNISTESESRFN